MALRVARFQVRRLLSQMKWWTVAVVGVLLGLYEASTVAAVSHINQWDVVWLGWSSLLISTLILWPLFMYLVVDVVLRDHVTAYMPLVVLRSRDRIALWLGTVASLGATALLYVVAVTLLMLVGAAPFVPFQWGWVAPPGPPAHGQLLFGNGVGVYPFLDARALWGHPPLLAVGVIWGLASLTLWAMSVAFVAATLRLHTVSLPLVLALVLRNPVTIVNPLAKELDRWMAKDPGSQRLKGVRHDALSVCRGRRGDSGPVGSRWWRK